MHVSSGSAVEGAVTMASTVMSGFETLCDKEFELVRTDSYRNLDREAAEIREHLSSHGLARSSA